MIAKTINAILAQPGASLKIPKLAPRLCTKTRLKNWVTYHGLSFNINPKMDNYKFIDACGLKNFKNTSLHELDINITEENFDKEFSLIFLNNLRNLK